MEAKHWNDTQERWTRHDSDPSLGDLLGRFANEFSRLIRLEIQLAKKEATEKVTTIGQFAGIVAAGAILAMVGLTILAMAIGFALGTTMPMWLAFLITAIAFLGLGGVLATTGVTKIKKTPMELPRTKETIDEDKQWVRKEMQDVKRDPEHLGHRR
jgi:uncharacterized membrane protein YqjE